MTKRQINPKVDAYLKSGCGRCPKGGTPDCKVNDWRKELEKLRGIILDCGLTEDLKWGIPCYTFKGRNVVLLAAFKESCVLTFVKGELLRDDRGILVKPGENTQIVRLVRFANLQQIVDLEPELKAYIREAVELEKAGVKAKPKKPEDFVMPEELKLKLNEDRELKAAFIALTPGRQRGYIIYFSQAKQSETRASRVEKCLPRILNGKGLND